MLEVALAVRPGDVPAVPARGQVPIGDGVQKDHPGQRSKHHLLRSALGSIPIR